MGSSDKYCLKWNDYRSNLSTAFQDLRASSDFFDVTLATDEAELRAHRVILSACSPHLREVLKRHSNESNPNLVIYMRGINHSDLEAIIEFMYSGEVNISQDDLKSFLAVAEDLKVRGLTQNLGSNTSDRPLSANSNYRSKTSLTPSSNSKPTRNGSASLTAVPTKRIKIDPLAAKDEKKKSSVSAEIDFAKSQAGETSEVGTEGDEEIQANEFFDFEQETYDDGHIMVDPSEIAGPSGIEVSKEADDQEYLTSEIGEYLNSMSARREDGQYQCLVCARVSRDLYNQRQHIMTHMLKDTEFLARLDTFVKNRCVQENPNTYSCLLCRMIISRGYYMVRQHFFSKHLKEDKYTEQF